MLVKSMLLASAFLLAADLPVVATLQLEPESGDVLASRVRLKRIRLSTGVELQVAESGPADGVPVLFLHGTSDSWFSFSRVLDLLPPDIRAIVPTQRGHGDSERPECCYGLDDFAADAVALLDAYGIERAHVVGHSMGSFIAQHMAANWPGRVNRLVLIASGTTLRIPPVLEFNEAVQALADPIPAGFAREFQMSTIFKSLPPAFLETVVQESEKLPARVWRAMFAGMLAADGQARPEQIRAQTLIVAGERDALWTQPQQDALQRAIPGSRLITYPNIGHATHWEDPARLAADLQNFLRQPETSVKEPEPRGREHTAHGHAQASPNAPDGVTLLTGLGDWQHTITTSSGDAQRFFDQGLRLAYGFNHDEAVRSFEQAVRHDSACAMCYWGIAYALGPNINLPMDAAAEPRARAALNSALRFRSGAAAAERALIEAMDHRYGDPAGVARTARDSAYATAMHHVAQRFPNVADAQVLYADALLNLRPWNQWTRDGKAQPGTLEVVAVLERVIASEPDHAGACHLYVHTVEASPSPERALPCAERLPALMPGAGHIVHMPAHVYLRVGRYQDAALANIAAVQADHRYLADQQASGFYPLFYAPHNLHFLWATYLLSGQRAKALLTARTLVQRVAVADARANAALEGFLPAAVLTLARFQDWNAVLAEPAPPADLRYVKGMWHYARGLALAGRRDVAAARIELDSVRTIAGQVPDDMIIILNPAPALLRLAAEMLAGTMAASQKSYNDAIAYLYAAVRLEDALTYDEPPPWYHSSRNLLGEVLLMAGRAAEAERVFQDDLRYVRETGWSLSGLERALRAQGKGRAAAAVAERFKQAWQYADVPVRN